MLMFENDYTVVWLLYLLGALGCLAVWYRMTCWMWRYLREPLWLLGAVLLLTPTLVDPERSIYAPALAIAVIDLLFELGNNAWRAVSDLLMYALLGFGLYLLLLAGYWLYRHCLVMPLPEEKAAGSGEQTLGEVLDSPVAGRIEPRL